MEEKIFEGMTYLIKLPHNCWDAVYTDERNYDWLLSFTNERDKALVKQLSVD